MTLKLKLFAADVDMARSSLLFSLAVGAVAQSVPCTGPSLYTPSLNVTLLNSTTIPLSSFAGQVLLVRRLEVARRHGTMSYALIHQNT